MNPMDVEAPRRQPRVRGPFLVALAVAVCGLAVRYTVLAQGATAPAPPIVTLSGVTGQGTAIELGVQAGHVRWLRTSLNARCLGRSSWSETWTPAEGEPVHFAMTGRTFVTEQHTSSTYSRGIGGEIGFAIRGTLTNSGGAEGTIRLVARFYRGGYQSNACDSLDVAWAVGPRARARLSAVPLGRQVGAYFAAVPSLATNVSPARRRFIARVDGTCVGTYNAMKEVANAFATRYRAAPDGALLNDEYYVESHAWQYDRLARLGQPPQARSVYDAWLANFRRRVLDERRGVVLEAHGRLAAAKRVSASVTALKAKGDVLGQEFGLVRCTSNVGAEVPILDDGQPLPLP